MNLPDDTLSPLPVEFNFSPPDINILLASALNDVGDNDIVRDLIVDAINASSLQFQIVKNSNTIIFVPSRYRICLLSVYQFHVKLKRTKN